MQVADQIRLRSRYGNDRTFRKTGPNQYTSEFDYLYVRGGPGFYDFDGGPFLSIGDKFADGVITELIMDEGGNLTVTTTKGTDNVSDQ